jgi:hypothetical protein
MKVELISDEVIMKALKQRRVRHKRINATNICSDRHPCCWDLGCKRCQVILGLKVDYKKLKDIPRKNHRTNKPEGE